jgi:hypothetical protein
MRLDFASAYFGGDEPDERQVQLYLDQMRQGIPVERPIVVRQPDGRHVPLDADALTKVIAAKRYGPRGQSGPACKREGESA